MNTILAIRRDKIVVLGSKEKIETLQILQGSAKAAGFGIEFVAKGKQVKDSVEEFIEKMLDGVIIQEDKPLKFGCFLKEKQVGKIIEEFGSQIKKVNHVFAEISPYIQELLCVKSEEDIAIVDKSGNLCVYFFQLLIEEIEAIIDEGVATRHLDLSQKIEDFLKTKRKEFKAKFGIKPIFFDLSYSPIIQSGGNYNLKTNAENDNGVLKHDCVVLSLGAKYLDFNSNIVRTIFINASNEEQHAYKVAFEAHRLLIKNLVKGAVIKDVYNKVRDFILARDSSLEASFMSNFGFGVSEKISDFF